MYTRLDLLLAMGIAWTLSGIIQIGGNSELKGAPKYSAFFIISVFGLTLLDNLIRPSGLSSSLLLILLDISRNGYFLIGPGLWFYCRSLLYPGKKVRVIFLLHLLPFIFMLLGTELNFFPPRIEPGSGQLEFQSFLWIELFSLLSRLIYSLITLIALVKQKKSAADFYSRLSSYNTLSWLLYLVVFYSLFFLLGSLINVIAEPSLQSTMMMIVRIVPSLLFIFFFSHFAFKQMIPEDRRQEKDRKSNINGMGKYKTSGISQMESLHLFEEVKEFLESSRIYLNSSITLDDLAIKIGLSRHHLSEIINREEESFYGFINSYRLKAFVRAVEEDSYPEYTIIAIAMECGFNSSSAFYSCFKKEKGMTPRQYVMRINKKD